MGAIARTLTALALIVGVAAGPAAIGAVPARPSMPLIENPVGGGQDTLVILYSGDGGWAAFDRGVVAGLAHRGVPSVGVNSLRYFWTRRTPQEAADDLAVVARRYLAAWRKRRIILVGYSFGANALPIIIPQLPPDLRGRLRSVALIGAARNGELQFHVGSWLNRAGPDATPLAPLMQQLRGVPAVCIYGDDEPDSACGAFPPGAIRPVRLPGGHHLDDDGEAVAETILGASA